MQGSKNSYFQGFNFNLHIYISEHPATIKVDVLKESQHHIPATNLLPLFGYLSLICHTKHLNLIRFHVLRTLFDISLADNIWHMKNVTLNHQLEDYTVVLKHLATRFTQDYDEIQDLVQETFIRAFKNMDQFFQNPNIVSWLFVIMRNTYINQYRHKQYRQSYEQHTLYQYQQAGCSEPYEEDGMEKKFILQDIQSLLKKMPGNYQELFNNYLKGYKYRELADLYGVPEGTIKSRIHLIRKNLQRKIGTSLKKTCENPYSSDRKLLAWPMLQIQ